MVWPGDWNGTPEDPNPPLYEPDPVETVDPNVLPPIEDNAPPVTPPYEPGNPGVTSNASEHA